MQIIARGASKEDIIMDAFVNYITSIVKYITDLVAYFRAKNDGKEDAVMPEFPRFVQLI